ncbi:MAG: YafY family transcriptional regulator [Rhodobacteraceae bacterium]|nr:YafY family transcriptional regulator [Paracoccaceae bacterium]
MRRTDRLFSLIQLLRDGQLHRAQDIAERLGVSLRTVYRDMDTLIAAGVPVQGERGLGYMLTAPITLPPLNLTTTELEALQVGIAVVRDAADSDLQAAARNLSDKIEAVLPEYRGGPTRGWGFAVYPFAKGAAGFRHMASIRSAIRSRQKLRLTYALPGEEQSEHVVRPLQIDFWGQVWKLTVWDDEAADFDVLRIDRIKSLKVLPTIFAEEPGKTLIDYLARIDAGRTNG